MKLDNSNRRHSNIIAGILVISVASIFLACAFGVWDHKVISNDDPLPNGVVISASSGNNIMENNHLVIPSGGGFLPVHEKINRMFDTEDEGWLYFDQSLIPDVFPLTITQTTLDTWDVTVYSYGGYEFISGYVKLWQKGDIVGRLNYDVETVVYNSLEYISVLGADYFVDVYTLNFTLDSNPINIDSNHIPSLYDGGWKRIAEGPKDLDKEVRFVEDMIWSGCGLPDQQFRVILAYKCMLRSPELPIKNFIASFNQ